ncbi:hypothetical protein [Bradyrhizobium sp. CCGUVB14]|uniref:hypothetical protein n=1 Tax=Bradyrhizobium sp. CCGUVB14 TaxID=2949628 RepID=UPI0020B3D6C3|nr:hypothetical protein [Bradyrhizobium sp. CCGUVB14]MCP3441990.1 hypothetical protein [Bradyrhizobium sp. CCGUVB14]
MLTTVCQLAGSMSFIDEIDQEFRLGGLDKAIAASSTAPIFDWLINVLSFQGISDRVARDYAAKHGRATWTDLEQCLREPAKCSRLHSYWQYFDCRYDKTSQTCAEPDHFDNCKLPHLRLRNGRLNQTAYSLYLFIRDVACGDLVGWIRNQIEATTAEPDRDLSAARQAALVAPLQNVYGVGEKTLSMALSTLLIGARGLEPLWFDTGKDMVVVDSLAHNFLHRTGILHDCGAAHSYGPACYAKGGCAAIIRGIAAEIDCRQFNAAFPSVFPRFIQHSIWRFCAAEAANICNGNRIDDRFACQDRYCRLGSKCDRKPLKGTYFQ